MGKKTILIVDDDAAIKRLLRAALEKNGYGVICYSSGEEALEKIDQMPFDAAILDIVLPGMDGLGILGKIRNHPRYGKVPVIMLTCKDSETETVLGLEMGADDYLSKPVRYHELLARLKNVFKRVGDPGPKQGEELYVHGIEINLVSRTVKINQRPVVLTYLEFELLAIMARNPGQVFTREFLLDTLWHEEQYLETRTVDVHVRRLRKKFAEHGLNAPLIETVRRVGYRMRRTTTNRDESPS